VTTPVAPTPDPDPTPGDTVAPTDPTIAAVPVAFGGSFKVFVTVGASFDAGGLDRYTVSLNDQFNRTLDPAAFAFDAFTFDLGPGDGLAEGTEYVITVTAVDLAGNASQTVGTTFTTPVLTPPFLLTTLGTATPAATASFSNLLTGEFLGNVGGTGIGGTADSGGFAYTPAPADDNFSITGRVASLFGGNPHGGIAIREGIAAGSPMVSFTVAADGASLRTRSTANANAVGEAISVTPAIWLRLEYASGAITASTSPDGVTWTVRGTTSLTFNGVPLVGFVFASRVNGTSTTAALDSFARVLTPPDTTAPSVPTLSATTTGTGSIRLDWTASTDAASGVREYRLTRNTVSIANVPFGVLTYTDTGLAAGTAYTYGIQAVDNAGNVSAEDTEIATTTAVVADLGTWLPIPEITVNAGFTGNIDTPLAPYYQPPSGQKLDSLAISSTNETGGSVTAAYPSGVAGSIVSNTTLRLACTSASAGSVSNLHVVPTISAISSSGGPGDTETDWATRSGGAGVFLANNFTQYANTAALVAAGLADQVSPGFGTACDVVLYTGTGGPPILSGGKALEIQSFGNAAQNMGTWRLPSWPGVTNGFYIQFHVAMNRAGIWWRKNGTSGQCKLANLGTATSGQLTLTNPRQFGFPGLMLNASDQLERVTSLDRYFQTAIDDGSPASPATILQGIQRFAISRGWGAGSGALNDASSYNGTNAALNYIDGRGFTCPSPDAVTAGGVPFLEDDWIVVEMYYSQPSGFRLWAAERGDAPVRIAGDWTPSTGSLSVSALGSAGNNAGGIRQVEFMHYDTPALAETGYRPTIKTWFGEVIASTNWIPFPGHLAGTEP
jgi:hypothetical protein